jgi:hypothetical protein
MRRIMGALAMATLVGLGSVALPTAGGAAPGRIRTVAFTGSSVFDFSTAGCSFAHQFYDATLMTKRGDTLHLEGCADLPTVGTLFPFTGTFTLASPGRRTVTGAVSGPIGGPASGPCDGGLVPGSIHFVLTPVRDTRRPHDPPAPLQLDGTWCSPAVPNVPGPISGTLTGELPPSSA